MPPPSSTRHVLRSGKSFPNEKIVKDVGKWVESVKELKSTTVAAEKPAVPSIKPRVRKLKKKKSITKPGATENPIPPKTPTPAENPYNNLKEECKNLKLPAGWIGGISGNNIIFNKFKITSFNAIYKMTAERGILIGPDCIVHVFLNGTETPETDSKKIVTVEDVKKAIKDADSFKICSTASKNFKSNQVKSAIKSGMATKKFDKK